MSSMNLREGCPGVLSIQQESPGCGKDKMIGKLTVRSRRKKEQLGGSSVEARLEYQIIPILAARQRDRWGVS